MAEAGLNYYDNRNKVEQTLLKTQYSGVVDYWKNQWTKPWYKYTRTRTKNYSYVGLSRTAAKRCVEAKMAQYTRTFYNWKQTTNGVWEQDKSSISGKYTELVASIEATRTSGTLYTVNIQVNEVAIIYTLGANYDLPNAFKARLGEWNYDED